MGRRDWAVERTGQFRLFHKTPQPGCCFVRCLRRSNQDINVNMHVSNEIIQSIDFLKKIFITTGTHQQQAWES